MGSGIMDRGRAEALAAGALAWLAADEERLMAFLGQTGAGVSDLRARINDPEFLGFVLDHLLSDEVALIAFCAAGGLRPDEPLRARAALPGGAVPEWT
ncbi:DUF3572 domain-containing protein [Limibaculum sp. FT325]|uniref:DUF3572 domain-containing protein n=1 Tax=Thermohalobaculum sediminis TaxID=2939436 RepID=UPI0020BDD4D4|nr:DUF3572 domain-containing protein [Limibaculum sediminis]MCL5775763.1 DUF3572 domain-containing protein [Limibaculum sediminis]